MKKAPLIGLAALLVPLGLSAADPARYRASLRGNAEVPSISTAASGTFHSYMAGDGLHYELTYKNLEGGNVAQAHIHLGQPHTNGGIIVWLCSNLPSPPTPTGTQACPASPGRVTGVISAMDVVGPDGQGISAGEFNALVAALGNGTAYANVHTATFGSGEIRGLVSRVVP